MPSPKQLRLKQIYEMLERCAPGFSKRETDHRILLTWNRQTHSLPKGGHGRRDRAVVESGHVKTMARKFRILDCAQREIPQLR